MTLKKLYDGGYPSPLLNGLKPVNTGAHFKINDNFFEAMSKEFSNHYYNIVSRYIRIYGENYDKVEISGHISKDNDYDNMLFVLTYYKGTNDTHRYRSTSKIPKKWEKYFDSLREAHRAIFLGKMK